MSLFVMLPIEARLALLFVLGAALATQLNRAIYRLAWHQRCISPWSPAPENVPPRRWSDRLPIVGWWGLRRESAVHGRGFWIRPMLIELTLPAGLAGLYAWQMQGGLYPELFRHPQFLATIPHVLHAQFAAHAALLSAMIVATFIDFDEQTIPDAVTLPVTIAGLCFAAFLPFSLLPIEHANRLTFLYAPAPWPWPMEQLNRWPALLTALACFTGWVLAVLPKTCTLRRGVWKGLVYLLVSMVRRTPWASVAVFLLVCFSSIAAVWLVGGDHWKGLYTALIGMAAGGGLIWSVRLVGRSALKREAMGFGDVTLMAMIGTFVGWQSTLIIFFLAPVAALLIAVIQWLLTRNNELAFGPYLCLATLLLLLGWPAWWDHFGGIFYLGMLVPAILVGCLAVMWGLLSLMRVAKEVFAGPEG